MICDNCGALIDDNEEFCPNCGMQLLDMHTQKKDIPKKKKKKYKGSKSAGFEDSRPVDKPIKQRYIENSQPEGYDYSQYFDDDEYEEYESPETEYNQEENKKSSGIRIGDIILFMLLALILGFIAGLLMFDTQSILQIPGINP